MQFEQACQRWRDLYRAARRQQSIQHSIIQDFSRSANDKRQAKRLRKEAESQIELLSDSRRLIQSDFYSYRYFASEGFLPGYNFPRLPLSAYIPARRIRTGKDEYLSRPRFLAITEFGPRSIVYHEGSRYIINKVIMPLTQDEEGEEIITTQVKLCPNCGYLHPISGGDGMDLCEWCEEPLQPALRSLFRLQNVSTKRRDKINSDEEERIRMGYEIQSGVRFNSINDQPAVRTATIQKDDELLARLSYGNAATLWRINMGWRRRKVKDQYGFVLDIQNGYWARNEAFEDDPEDPMSAMTQRVIPYVEDRKNCLLIEPLVDIDKATIASLSAAIKSAIQVVYQLEDREIAAEPLPSRDERRLILLYESSEGGAGVLRRLVDDSNAFAEVAREALALCHFEPGTGEDLRRAPHSHEDCEAACYDCLMSYYNQPDHLILDRQLILEPLMDFSRAKVNVSPVVKTREEHLKSLLNLCDSDFEEQWLNHIYQQGYRLPSKAQQLIRKCDTRPDFLFEDEMVVIYIDGYYHLDKNRRERDKEKTDCLEDLGYTVIRFGIFDDWEELIQNNSYVFGKVN